jgi:hypothetical protein
MGNEPQKKVEIYNGNAVCTVGMRLTPESLIYLAYATVDVRLK